MGNMAISYMTVGLFCQKNFPTIKKQVDIAGHFNGIIGMERILNRCSRQAEENEFDLSRTDETPAGLPKGDWRP